MTETVTDGDRALLEANKRLLAKRAEMEAADAAWRQQNPPKCCCGQVVAGLTGDALNDYYGWLRRQGSIPPWFRCAKCEEARRQAAEEAARTEAERQAEWNRLAAEAEDRRRREAVAAEEARQAAELAAVRADMPGTLARVGVPPVLVCASFQAAEAAGDLPPKLLTAARRWAAGPTGLLLLTGGPGAGKSFLAVSILAEVLRTGLLRAADVLFLTEAAYLDACRQEYGNIQRPARPPAVPLLVVDDLASAFLSDFRRGEVERLIRQRYDRQLPSVFSSNLSVAELADRIGGRAASVLAAVGAEVWAFGTRDLRRAGHMRAGGDAGQADSEGEGRC